MEIYLGEFSALLAALCFSLATTAFTFAGRKFSATFSMTLSMLLSFLFLLPFHLALTGEVFPSDASLDHWWLLGASSVIGYVISSVMLLRAFQYIGPRLTMLIVSFTPVFGALLAWLFIGQALSSIAIAGIALVIFGIAWVVADGKTYQLNLSAADYRRGLALAVAGAFGQGVSYVFMSEGVSDGFHPMSAGVIRTLVGVAFLWFYMALRGQLLADLRMIPREWRALALLAVGSLTGPVIGTSLVLLSLQYISVGVSSTLSGTTPIILIPVGYLVFKERIGIRAIMGSLLAIAGIALLFSP